MTAKVHGYSEGSDGWTACGLSAAHRAIATESTPATCKNCTRRVHRIQVAS
jgi:hypothetical protein